MPHAAGERRRCEDCGAEILFTKACPCPDREPKQHYDTCCGKEMRLVEEGDTSGAREHSHSH